MTCIAEVFQHDQRIDPFTGAPRLAGFAFRTDLRLLDVASAWITRAGGSMAISAVERAWPAGGRAQSTMRSLISTGSATPPASTPANRATPSTSALRHCSTLTRRAPRPSRTRAGPRRGRRPHVGLRPVAPGAAVAVAEEGALHAARHQVVVAGVRGVDPESSRSRHAGHRDRPNRACRWTIVAVSRATSIRRRCAPEAPRANLLHPLGRGTRASPPVSPLGR